MGAKNYKKLNKGLIKRIEEGNDDWDSQKITDRNKEILKEFYKDLKSEGSEDSTIYTNLQHLKKLAEDRDFNLDEASEEQIRDLVIWINDGERAKSTKRSQKVILKRFYKWVNDGEYPEKVDFINTTEKTKNEKLPEDILDEEDIKTLIKNANHTRDKALISLLWETGARVGEIIDLEIGDFKDHKHGLKVVISGKTGARRLSLISSVPHIRSWFNSHPDGENLEAPAWVNIGNTNFGEKMSYKSILEMLKRTNERADLNKKVNPHAFRHGRATYLAQRFTEAELCEWMGWVQGSDQAQRYVHLSGSSVDSKYARLHGIEDEEKPEESQLSPIECPRCDEKNDPEAKFCYKCGQALKEFGPEVEKETTKLTVDKAKEIASDPDFKRIHGEPFNEED